VGKEIEEHEIVDGVNSIFREALTCETEEQLCKTCLSVAEKLSGSKFGFIGEINQAGRYDCIALSDPGWAECRMPKTEATKLLKNLEIRGIWGRVLKDERSLITNSPATHTDRVGTPKGHPKLTSFLGVPLKRAGKTFGMIALANKESGYSDIDEEAVETLSVAIVEALTRKRIEIQANKNLEELKKKDELIGKISTPLVEVWEGIVMLSLIGIFDSARAKQFTESVLEYIARTKCDIVVMDISGIAAIDTQTANHILRTIQAVRLMGSEMIVTGVRPDVAVTLVSLGVELSGIVTCGTLREGLEYAYAKLGLKLIRSSKG
jgi:anti-anti-sigma regulatory factor